MSEEVPTFVGVYDGVDERIRVGCIKFGLAADEADRAVAATEWALRDGARGGHKPTTLVASAVYAATLFCGDDHATQREVSDSFGSSRVAIRNMYPDIADAYYDLLEAEGLR